MSLVTSHVYKSLPHYKGLTSSVMGADLDRGLDGESSVPFTGEYLRGEQVSSLIIFTLLWRGGKPIGTVK